jgi:hypothetical protein
MTTRFHFSKDIIDAKPNRWYLRNDMSLDGRAFTFSERHWQALEELRAKKFQANLEDHSNTYVNGKCYVVYVQFDNEADEAFFLLKYSDGVELDFMG